MLMRSLSLPPAVPTERNASMLRLPVRCLAGQSGRSIRHSPAWRLEVVRKGRALRPQHRCTRPAHAAMGHGSDGASSNKSWGKGSVSASRLTTMITNSTDLPSLMRLVEQHSASFDDMHAAAALAKAAKLVRKGRAQTDAVVRGNVKQLVSIAQQHLPASGARGLANMLWAVATLGYRDEHFVRQIIAQASGKLQGCNPQNLSNMALALATLGVQDPAFMQRLLQEASGKLHDFNPQNVSNLVCALGKLQLRQDNTDFVAQLLSVSLPKLPQFSSQGLSNTALGLAKLRHYDPHFMQQLLAAAGPMLNTSNPQQLANTALALAILNHNDAPFTDRLLQQVAQQAVTSSYQNICNTLWSLCILDHDAAAATPTVEALLRAVGRGLDLGSQGLVLNALRQVYQYLVTAEGRGHISAQLQQEGWYQRLKRAGQSAWAQGLKSAGLYETQQQVLAAVRRLPVCEGAQSEQMTEDGLLIVDVVVLLPGGRKVALEVDGPQHFMSNTTSAPRMLIGRRVWRNRMLKQRGWTVVRVSSADWLNLGEDATQQHNYLSQRMHEAGVALVSGVTSSS